MSSYVQPGDVVLYDGETWFSTLVSVSNSVRHPVQAVKGNNWTHAAVVGGTYTKNDGGGDLEMVTLYEARMDGFVTREQSVKELQDRVDGGSVVVGRVNGSFDRDVKDVADRFLGRNYGYMDIVKLVFPSVKWNPGAQSLICSEAVGRVLFKATCGDIDFTAEYGLPVSYIEPMHLWKSSQIQWGVLQ